MTDVYDQVAAYELAMSYRDVAQEVDCLMAWFERHTGRAATSVLDLACGPGDHALEFARRDVSTVALDLSPAMCARVDARAAEQDLAVTVVDADMRDYDLGRRVDLALLMLDSASHLLDADDFVANLTTTARHLRPGGLYILEMAHPAGFLTSSPKTTSEWEIDGADGHVYVHWGGPDDPFDPIRQVKSVRVQFVLTRPGEAPQSFEDVVALRQWPATEFEAIVRLSGCFEIAGQYGGFEPDVAFDNSDESWRMITVLRSRSPSG